MEYYHGVPELLTAYDTQGEYTAILKNGTTKIWTSKASAKFIHDLINPDSGLFYEVITCDEMEFPIKEITINNQKKEIILKVGFVTPSNTNK